MKILNCETLETCLQSLSNILGTPEKHLLSDLRNIDFETMHEQSGVWKTTDWNQFIYQYFVGKYHVDVELTCIDRIYWFHFSKTLNPSGFKKGIFPLGMMRDKLQDDLDHMRQGIAINESWIPTNEICDKYRDGPYGMLIRDIAFRSTEVSNHNYLMIPEYIEDTLVHNPSAATAFKQAAKSVIVCFYSSQDRDVEYLIAPVLVYLYQVLQKKAFSLGDGSNTCYDAAGQIIDASRILSVEILPSDWQRKQI